MDFNGQKWTKMDLNGRGQRIRENMSYEGGRLKKRKSGFISYFRLSFLRARSIFVHSRPLKSIFVHSSFGPASSLVGEEAFDFV